MVYITYHQPIRILIFKTPTLLLVLQGVIDYMEITVKGSSIICPAQETPKERQWISNLDMAMTAYYHLLVNFYRPNGSSQFFNAQVLKEALSKTLVSFYPMAGRLGSDDKGRLEIVCNAEGVLWVEAETNFAIDDLGDFKPSLKLRRLVPFPNSGDPFSHPLFMAQLTTFKCGGVCLGVGIHHTLADGTTTTNFLNSWSEIARGLPQITVPPLIDRTLLRARVPPTPKFHHVEYDSFPSLNTSWQPNPQVSVFKITRDQLNTLKSKSIKNESTIKFSTHTILAAYIWRCVSKARSLSYNQVTMLNLPTNGRTRLQPPLPSGYLGNVVFMASLTALSGNLQSEPFMKTVERIHGAVNRMDDEYLRSALDYLEILLDITTVRRGAQSFQCPNLTIINWMGFFPNAANFGWGQPIYVGPTNVAQEGKIFLVPSPESNGSVSLIACLDASHMENFQKHLYEGLMSFDKIKARF